MITHRFPLNLYPLTPDHYGLDFYSCKTDDSDDEPETPTRPFDFKQQPRTTVIDTGVVPSKPVTKMRQLSKH